MHILLLILITSLCQTASDNFPHDSTNFLIFPRAYDNVSQLGFTGLKTPVHVTGSGRFHSAGGLENKFELRVPGEFEKQELLLMACSSDFEHIQTIAEVAKLVGDRIKVAAIYKELSEKRILEQQLKQREVRTSSVLKLQLNYDTKWIRDYGPTIIEHKNSVRAIDWKYGEDRKNDDVLSYMIGARTNTRVANSKLTLEGGNLLSNGQGLIVTSTKFFASNDSLPPEEAAGLLAQSLNAKVIIALEPLKGEETQHVDMFLTFVTHDTAIVGSYAPEVDPENAKILDRNARVLSQIETATGKLKVVRIPMGRKDDGYWRTYTNCIFANGVLIVPTYPGSDSADDLKVVLSTYRKVLPGWQIKTVDSNFLIEHGGALHCASLNVKRLNETKSLTDESETKKEQVWHYLRFDHKSNRFFFKDHELQLLDNSTLQHIN